MMLRPLNPSPPGYESAQAGDTNIRAAAMMQIAHNSNFFVFHQNFTLYYET